MVASNLAGSPYPIGHFEPTVGTSGKGGGAEQAHPRSCETSSYPVAMYRSPSTRENTTTSQRTWQVEGAIALAKLTSVSRPIQ